MKASVPFLFCLLLLFPSGASAWLGFLESPAPNATVSGIGFISGWKCGNHRIAVIILNHNQVGVGPAHHIATGIRRDDTERMCDNGGIHNGFITQVNWNHYKPGAYTAIAYYDGQEFARNRFTVGGTGKEFLRGLAFDVEVPNFPREGHTGYFVWNESTQHLELAEVDRPPEEPLFEPTDLAPLAFLLDRDVWTIEVPDIDEWKNVSAQFDGATLAPGPADITFFEYERGVTPWRDYPAIPPRLVEIVGWIQGKGFSGGEIREGLPHVVELGGVWDVLDSQLVLELGADEDRYALVVTGSRLFEVAPRIVERKDVCYILVFNQVGRTADGGMETRAFFAMSERSLRNTQHPSQCIGPQVLTNGLQPTRLSIRP